MKLNMIRFAMTAALIFICNQSSWAQAVDVVGGQTNVLLDTATLEQAASLALSGTDGPVIAPGNLGGDSVAFPINNRTGNLPTTFAYDPNNFLGDFSGTIEHTGRVLFNSDTVTVGDFTIGFDAARATGAASGFFVESTAGIAAILFDIANPAVTPTASNLEIQADLIVSPEFAQFLQTNSLAATDLTGADVGDALVQATAVPEPTSLALMAIGLLGLGRSRSRIRR